MKGLLVLLFWVLLFYPVWSPRCRRLRKRMVSGNEDQGIHVSPTIDTDMSKINELEADLLTWGIGPDWIQDEPFPELFDEEE